MRQRLGRAFAVAAAGTVGMFALYTPGVHAATPTLVSAEGDSFIAGGTVSLLSGRIDVGPLVPAQAYAPGPTPEQQKWAANCELGSCIKGILDRLNVVRDNGKASASGASDSTDCLPNGASPITGIKDSSGLGGNACSELLGVGLLSALVPQASSSLKTVLPAGGSLITLDAINVQSLTPNCGADTPSYGFTSVLDLKIDGNEIQVPDPLPPNFNLQDNTGPIGGVLKALGIQIILNEQHPDNQDVGGHGLTVNGLHVIVNGPLNSVLGADLIVAHTHSSATCSNGPTPPPPPCPGTSSSSTCNVPAITKTDSVQTVNPGGSLTYTVAIAQASGCPISSITDTLPPGFTYVSSTGDLPAADLVKGTNASGQQTLTWVDLVNNIGVGGPAVLTEHITVQVGASVGAGTYVNHVDILSGNCGESHGADTGVTVVPVGPPNTGNGGQKPNLPNTAGILTGDGSTIAPIAVAVLFLGVTGVVAARRRSDR